MRIYLIGYMGSGKSTVARKLAARLGFTTYDTDVLFEERFRISIQQFFDKYDEPLFRKLERNLLKETLFFNNAVIATGGGTPCFYDNMDWMNAHGTTVYLKLSPQSLARRLSEAKRKRPLLKEKSNLDLMEFVNNHLRQRNIWYSQAQHIVKGESVDLDQLVRLLQ